MAKRWVLWAWSVDQWTAVFSSRSEDTLRAEERDCNASGLRTVVLPKGVRP